MNYLVFVCQNFRHASILLNSCTPLGFDCVFGQALKTFGLKTPCVSFSKAFYTAFALLADISKDRGVWETFLANQKFSSFYFSFPHKMCQTISVLEAS